MRFGLPRNEIYPTLLPQVANLLRYRYNNRMTKERVDVLLVQRGLAESRSQAQRLIMAGQVRTSGQIVYKPAVKLSADAPLEVEQAPRFVSRGGLKLLAAFEGFDLQPQDQVCADVGASTGGFTDCLLQYGAARVYAIDVGQGILHWKLRNDHRVVVMEKTNARYVTNLSEHVSLVTVDASFISLKILLPVIKNWLPSQGGNVVALIKPQFEAGRIAVSRGSGVIRSPDIHREVLLDVLSLALELNYYPSGLLRSPLLGPKGNVEFLAWLSFPKQEEKDLHELVGSVLRNENT